VTERDYQATIIEAAHIGGWRVASFRPARTRHGWRTPLQGDAGFVDMVLAHPYRGVIFAELKRKPNRLTVEQAAWGLVLRHAGHDWRVVWVPEMLDEFCQELAG
jgi:hypothetical protein